MPAAKQNPETLELRAKPRPVTRLNKKALMIAAGGAALIIFGAMSVALKPPRASDGAQAKELYNVEAKPTAEGLDALPKSYAEVKPQLAIWTAQTTHLYQRRRSAIRRRPMPRGKRLCVRRRSPVKRAKRAGYPIVTIKTFDPALSGGVAQDSIIVYIDREDYQEQWKMQNGNIAKNGDVFTANGALEGFRMVEQEGGTTKRVQLEGNSSA